MNALASIIGDGGFGFVRKRKGEWDDIVSGDGTAVSYGCEGESAEGRWGRREAAGGGWI